MVEVLCVLGGVILYIATGVAFVSFLVYGQTRGWKYSPKTDGEEGVMVFMWPLAVIILFSITLLLIIEDILDGLRKKIQEGTKMCPECSIVMRKMKGKMFTCSKCGIYIKDGKTFTISDLMEEEVDESSGK